jgi:hypothetical protein
MMAGMQRSIAMLVGVAIAAVAGTLLFVHYTDESRREAEVNRPRADRAGESRPAMEDKALRESIDALRAEVGRLRVALAEGPRAPAATSETG